MGSWEDELDLDLSDIWAVGSKPVQQETQQRAEDDGGDDLAFPTQPPAPRASQPPQLGQSENRVTRLQSENGVTRLQSENGVTPLLDADVADAPTQVASLSAEPFVSRGGPAVPPATQKLPSRENDPKQRLPPLPSFQPVVSRDGPAVPIATQSLASRDNDPKQRLTGSRNPSSRERAPQQPVDIRKYFGYRGSSSGGEGGRGGPAKKPRIPGPVGDLVQKDHSDDADGVDGHDNAFGTREDEFNDKIFRKGAWISALQSLDVEEFDPARYAILKVTASIIGSSRTQQIPHFVAVIKELTPNVFGDAAVILKDPTGTVAGMLNNKVFSNTDYARAISPGAVIVLKQVAIFSPSAHYLNISINNVVQVFSANTDLPQGFKAPKQQQAPPPRQEQPPQPRSQPKSQLQPPPPPHQEQLPQPRSQFKPQPPPSQQEHQPPQPRSQPRSDPQSQSSPLQQEQPSQPRPDPQPQSSPLQQDQPSQPRSQPRPSPPVSISQEPKAPEGIAAAEKVASWDLLSPAPSPPLNPNAPEGIPAAEKMGSWDLLSPSPSPPLNPNAPEGIPAAEKMGSWDLLSPSPPQEPNAPEGVAEAAKMAGWDLTDDMEALLNEDVDDFYA